MPSLPHTIKRTGNRTSRATIRDGSIVIGLARNLSSREEARHIDVLLRRMAKAFLKEQTRTPIDPFTGILQGDTQVTVYLITGQSMRFTTEVGVRARTKAIPNGWHITKAPHTDKRTFHSMLWRLLAKSASASIRSLVRGINEETIRADIRSVTLKFMRSRWGSCGRKGQIALSTPLLLTSPDILRYVILHELCHMPHPNHSAKFWRTVEKYMPDYKEKMKELRKFKLHG
ncbi:M48 family peptidase [Candidatus Peribacteria bacterium]|nr:M48 family peptidase [Candidatus Peribacteria bacterium]